MNADMRKIAYIDSSMCVPAYVYLPATVSHLCHLSNGFNERYVKGIVIVMGSGSANDAMSVRTSLWATTALFRFRCSANRPFANDGLRIAGN